MNYGNSDGPSPADPLRVHFDTSCCATLRAILNEAPGLFRETSADEADAVLFGDDTLAHLDHSELLRAHPAKSVCVSETDTPTFRIPALYAANANIRLAKDRAATISYVISQRDRPNTEVMRLAGTAVPRTLLYSFMGGSNSWARKRLFRHARTLPDAIVEPTDSYNHWISDEDDAAARNLQRRRYAETIAASKFALCPRGCGLSSYRMFESMSLGVAPVIISDAWRPSDGVDWSFAIFVPERDIPRIDSIVRSHEPEWQDRGRQARETFLRQFAPEVAPRQMHGALRHVLASYNPGREALAVPAARLRTAMRRGYWMGYGAAKYVVLSAAHATGRKIPVQLNRPVEVQIGRAPSARRV